jgi:NAD(P)-dependent dehydrogenase (short-subunit alcohol dehydrogenase family)
VAELKTYQHGRRAAVITGAAGGMGRACARRMGTSHRLVLADVSSAACEAEAEALQDDGYDVAAALAVDVSDPDGVEQLASAANAAGDLGALIHTAGLSADHPDWRRTLQVNFAGTALLLDTFLARAKPGSVACCIASTAGHFLPPSPELETIYDRPNAPDAMARLEAFVLETAAATGRAPSHLAYMASKRGILRMVKDGTLDWAGRGARIVTISPGLTLTAMGRKDVQNPFTASMLEQMPLGRWGTAMDVANAAYFLCSPEASFITGCDLLVDGGFVPLMARGGARPGG